MELVERARELLASIEYINIATVSADGQPWNTPVYGRHDGGLNFYWSSWKKAQHSRNIRENERVFITLYDSTRKRGDNHRRCLYLQGKAQELDLAEDIERAFELLYARDGTEFKVDPYVGEGLKRIYRASVEKVWLNDTSERELTPETLKMRVKVPLEDLIL